MRLLLITVSRNLYESEEMFPLPVDENQLMKLGFEKQELMEL